MNKQICFIGNCDINTGPSNVNKMYRSCLYNRVKFLKTKNKALRMIETVILVTSSKAVIISGLSYINDIACVTSMLLHKPMVYLQHGSAEYELDINHQYAPKTLKSEKRILDYSSRIISVSQMYMNWFSTYKPEYQNKMRYVNNGIDWDSFQTANHKKTTSSLTLLVMGGGRPQKRNIIVAKATQILNVKYHVSANLIVLGRDYQDTEELKKMPYTTYIGQVSENRVKELLTMSDICVLNSTVESFGLAPIEALMAGCDLVLSKNVGVISIMQTIDDNEVVTDCEDADEVASKILWVSEHPNNNRLLAGINKEKTSLQSSSEKLYSIARECIDE